LNHKQEERVTNKKIRVSYGKLSPKQRAELNEQIKFEIAQHSDDRTFLPDEYRRLRRSGLQTEEIHYDMCHVFR
jgi:hypothetical protein